MLLESNRNRESAYCWNRRLYCSGSPSPYQRSMRSVPITRLRQHPYWKKGTQSIGGLSSSSTPSPSLAAGVEITRKERALSAEMCSNTHSASSSYMRAVKEGTFKKEVAA